MRNAIESMVARRRGVWLRFACLPAVVIFEWMVISAADRRVAIEGWLLLAVCLVQTVRPTLLGWALLLNWFALALAGPIELSLRGYPGSRALLSFMLVLLPFLSLLVLRPRIGVGERFARAFALLIGLVGIVPLLAV
jgi:hypothetical protein